MIITITGKPCSGKSAVIEYMTEKYGFEKFSAGAIFRRIATERGVDILELNRLCDTSIDKLVDDEIVRVGERDIDKNMIFDSRTAWHFIPKSFKVFLDITPKEQARRLMNSGRSDEIVDLTEDEAIASLNERWNLENERYYSIYQFDNRDQSVFDCVVDTSNLSIGEVGDKIMEAYEEYVNKD